MSQSAFQQNNGGAGGATFVTLTAGEAINGSVDPKAVFVGTFPNPQSNRDGRAPGGDTFAAGQWDRYETGRNVVHSIDWSNKMFAYKTSGGRTYNAIQFEIWNNGFNVSLAIDFYNTGVATPTGVPFKSFNKTVSCPNVGGIDANVYLMDDNVDCTATLGGGNNYWVVMTWGLGSAAVDIAPKINATAPDFLEWNGAVWVTPFSSVQRLPGMVVFLAPTGGQVYQSLGNDVYANTTSGSFDEVAYGRDRFLGFVTSNVTQGSSVRVQLTGAVGFTTPFTLNPGNRATLQLGNTLGIVEGYDVFTGPSSNLPIGNTYDAQNVIINKVTNFVFQGGQYQ